MGCISLCSMLIMDKDKSEEGRRMVLFAWCVFVLWFRVKNSCVINA